MGSRAPNLSEEVHPYATHQFAKTLSHIGEPLYVRSWDTYVLARRCAGQFMDAMGGYPRAVLAPHADLSAGVSELRTRGMVSVTLALDCLSGPSPTMLGTAFQRVRAFKTHYVVDTHQLQYEPSRHHRQEIRRAERRGVDVQVLHPLKVFDQWAVLYEELIARHRIPESSRYSESDLLKLAACPGLVAVAAFIQGQLVSCHLWVEHDGCAWSHLAASNDVGYASGAAYAIYDRSIRHFSNRIIDLGSTAGMNDAPTDGLAKFKSGFANKTAVSYLVGSILDERAYTALCEQTGAPSNGEYFPAYRAPTGFVRPESA